jgi:hypothetical protein
MVIVFVLILGVLQCSINKYTVWNQGVNSVDGTRYIFHSDAQKLLLQSVFSVYWNYYTRENTQISPFYLYLFHFGC